MTEPAQAIPPGWYLLCPVCHWTGGQHVAHCRGVAVPRTGPSGDLPAVPPPVPAPVPVPDPAPVPQVVPQPGGRLEQLRAMLEPAEAALKAAKDHLDLVRSGIMAEAAAAFPGQKAVDIAPAAPGQVPLRLRWHPGTWYVPVGTLRKKHADIWDELRTQKRGYWQLHPLDGSES